MDGKKPFTRRLKTDLYVESVLQFKFIFIDAEKNFFKYCSFLDALKSTRFVWNDFFFTSYWFKYSWFNQIFFCLNLLVVYFFLWLPFHRSIVFILKLATQVMKKKLLRKVDTGALEMFYFKVYNQRQYVGFEAPLYNFSVFVKSFESFLATSDGGPDRT